MEFAEVKEILKGSFPDLDMVSIASDSMVFEERVRQKCFHCKNYNYKWTCPPKIPCIDYKKLFSEYSHAAVVICGIPIDENDFEEKRIISTNRVHKALLFMEGALYKRGNALAISFIGGSCKLCKNGCSKEHCMNPYQSRTPWEATGVNIVETLKKINIEVRFPPKGVLYRYGLFLW